MLESASPGWRSPRKLLASRSFRHLDATEKGAATYFLGMLVSKLFCWRLLGTPWVMHVNVWADQFQVHFSGRSRPDLLGQRPNGDWIVLESKGRTQSPGRALVSSAKEQSVQVLSVNDRQPALRIGCVSYFRRGILHFHWEDPEPEKTAERFDLSVRDEDWRHYFEPTLALVRHAVGPEPIDRRHVLQSAGSDVEIPELDLSIGIHPKLLPRLLDGAWGEARALAVAIRESLQSEGYAPDGIRVRTGPSWHSGPAASPPAG